MLAPLLPQAVHPEAHGQVPLAQDQAHALHQRQTAFPRTSGTCPRETRQQGQPGPRSLFRSLSLSFVLRRSLLCSLSLSLSLSSILSVVLELRGVGGSRACRTSAELKPVEAWRNVPPVVSRAVHLKFIFC